MKYYFKPTNWQKLEICNSQYFQTCKRTAMINYYSCVIAFLEVNLIIIKLWIYLCFKNSMSKYTLHWYSFQNQATERATSRFNSTEMGNQSLFMKLKNELNEHPKSHGSKQIWFIKEKKVQSFQYRHWKGEKYPQKRWHLQQFMSSPVLICTFLVASCP